MQSTHGSARNLSSFDEFTIRFEKASNGIGVVACVEQSPIGTTPAVPLRLPKIRSDPRDGLSVAQGLGRELFDALFHGPIRENLLASIAGVNSHSNRGLRIRLKITRGVVEEVASLPWELLYRADTQDFLSRNVRTPIVRHLEVNRATPSPRETETLRVLAVVSNPRGTEALETDVERVLLQQSLADDQVIRLRFLEPPTLANLRQQVRSEPFDILHFAGHGCFDSQGQGILLFEDASRDPAPVSGAVLADILKGFEELRFVFLNACESACLPSVHQDWDPFHGMASAMVIGGVPAVVGMQVAISDAAAVEFSGSFYKALISGDSLESAVTEGRVALLSQWPDTLEWATPVLFLGCPNGRLFVLDSKSRTSDSTTKAKKLLLLGDVETAARVIENALRDDADNLDLLTLLYLSRLARRPLDDLPIRIADSIDRSLIGLVNRKGVQKSRLARLLLEILRRDYYEAKKLVPTTVLSLGLNRPQPEWTEEEIELALTIGPSFLTCTDLGLC